jgi:GSH-dependent disulfide-bond oxidoreductase
MIDLYYYPTPNSLKITIYCEEAGLPYRIIPLDLPGGAHKRPEYLKINPNAQMPAIIDHDGPSGAPYKLFESGAILMYLAEKTGLFMPRDARGRYDVIQWLMLQMARVGPFLGQAVAFRRMDDKIPFAIDKFTTEARRLYNVINTRVAEVPYLAGDYSIADIATYPWIRIHDKQGLTLEEFPHLKNWYDRIEARPTVQRGIAVPWEAAVRTPPLPA